MDRFHSTAISKALKEVVFLRIGFNPTRSTSPCYKPKQSCIQHTVIHNTIMNLKEENNNNNNNVSGSYVETDSSRRAHCHSTVTTSSDITGGSPIYRL